MKLVWATARVTLLKLFARFYLEVLIVSVVAVVGVGYWWLLRAGFTQLATQGRYSLLSSQTHANYLERYLEDQQRLQAQYDGFNREHLDRFASLLPATPDLPGLFVQLQALAQHNGLVLSSVQFAAEAGEPLSPVSPPPAGAGQAGPVAARPAGAAVPSLDGQSPIKTVEITAVLSHGAYEALQHFLSAVEGNLRLLNVSSLSFGSAQGGPYSIRMEAYYLPR